MAVADVIHEDGVSNEGDSAAGPPPGKKRKIPDVVDLYVLNSTVEGTSSRRYAGK